MSSHSIKLNRNALLLLVLTQILGCVEAYKTMSLVQDNGSMDQYYAPVEDVSSDSTTSVTSVAAVATSTTDDSATKTTSTTNSEVENTNDSTRATENAKTTVTPTATETAQSESTTIWWTPESELASSTTTASTTDSQTSSTTSSTSTTASSSSSSTSSSTSASISKGKCQTAWGQCGGADYTGVSCCEAGLTCMHANSYWARCVAASTMASASGSAPTGGSTSNKQHLQLSTYYDYSTVVSSETETFTNSAGKVVTSVIASTSVGKVEKGVSSVVEASSNAGVAGAGLYTPAAAALAALALLI